MSTIEDRTSDEHATIMGTERAIELPDEETHNRSDKLNEEEQGAPLPKKAPTKRKKPANATSLVTEAAETPKPKRTTSKRPKKNVELVSSVGEMEDTPKPKRTTTRSRKKPVEPTVPTAEAPAMPLSALEATSVAADDPSQSVAQQPIVGIEAATSNVVGVEETSVDATLTTEEAPIQEQPALVEMEETPNVVGVEEAPIQEQPALVEMEETPNVVEVEETSVDATLMVEEAPIQEQPALVEMEAIAPSAEVEEIRVEATLTTLAEAEEPPSALLEVASVVEEHTAVAPVVILAETPVSIDETPAPQPTTERRHLVKSAGLVSLGNLGSSLLGMVRQVVLARLGSLYAGPFLAALTPANNFYQLLVNGAVSGALIPAFNDYSAPKQRDELRRIVFTLVNLVLLITLAAAIGYTLISPWFINALLSQLPANQRGLALEYSQIIFFSLLALGPFSILLAALYALKEFGWPAFATAAYHVGIILGAIGVALFGSYYLGSIALPVGVLVGAVGEVALLLPGIRNQRLRYMLVLDLKHPALRHIFKLYLPVFLGFLFTTGAVLLDLSLQSQTPEHATAIAAMGFATTLIQFPVGLVAAALSFAVLPTLSEHVREHNDERFKQTLLLGFRLGLLLMVPAMVGLITLRTPITYLLFAHGKFGTSGADLTAVALQSYAYQLPFVALDQLLIAAFYARKNTKTPVVIGVVAIFFYLIVALPFYRNIGVPALAFANTMQNSMHAIILLILLRRVMGVLHIRTALPAILKICFAALLMGLATWGALILLGHVSFFSLAHIRGQLLTLIVAGGVAVAVYAGVVLLLKVEEIHLLKGAVLAKLGKK